MKLENWCDSNKLERKLLLTDNVNNANKLKRIANKKGCIITNLRVASMSDIARELYIEQCAEKGLFEKIELADNDTMVLIVYKLLKEDKGKKYTFVPAECLCVETAQEVLKTINALRAGCKTPEYDKTSSTKVIQLKKLVAAYEAELDKQNLYDSIRLMSLIVGSKNPVSTKYKIAIMDYMQPYLTWIEKEFLKKITTECEVIDTSNKCDYTANFYEAYGQYNEIQAVVEDIVTSKQVLGKVTVLYTSSNYEQGLRATFDEAGIKYAFTRGRSIGDASYLTLFDGLLTWLQDDYTYTSFRRVVDNDLVQLGKDYAFGEKVGIGWGIDRYKMFVNRMKHDATAYEQLLLKHRRVHKSKATGAVVMCSKDFIDFVDKAVRLVSNISALGNSVGPVYRRLLEFIENNTKGLEYEKHYLTQLKGLRKYFDHAGNMDSINEVLTFIQDKLSRLSISDSTEGNEVEIIKLDKVEVLERPYVYVIGLSHEAFGVKSVDSPVLGDVEIATLVDATAGYVIQELEENVVRLDRFKSTINTFSGEHITFVAATYDTRNLREIAKSQAYEEFYEKLATTDPIKKGYPNLCDLNSNYVIDKTAVYKGAAVTSSSSQYTYIKESTVGSYKLFTIEQLSPTAIQNAMKCPYKLEYDLKHFDLGTLERNVGAWLPANEKGNLYHQVFEEYCDKVLKGKKITASDKLDLVALQSIFDNAVDEFTVLVPSGSNIARIREIDMFFEEIKVYLEDLYKELATSTEGWLVKDCEHEFMSDDYVYLDKDGNVCVPGTCDAVRFKYKGTIDRIDTYIAADGTEHARVIDYKTGRKEKLEEKIKSNEQIQHAIYSTCLKETVDYFEYDFPCDENQTLKKSGKDIAELPDAYRRRLADIVINRKLEGPKERACDYCDYKEICAYRMNIKR